MGGWKTIGGSKRKRIVLPEQGRPAPTSLELSLGYAAYNWEQSKDDSALDISEFLTPELARSFRRFALQVAAACDGWLVENDSRSKP